MAYASGSPKTKARVGLIARQENHAVEADLKTSVKAILLVALLEVLAQLPPSERLALLEYLGKRRARSNGEKGIDEGDVG